MVLERKLVTCAEVAAPTGARKHNRRRRLLLQTDLRQFLAGRPHPVVSRVFVDLVGILAACGDREAAAGRFEIVVGLCPLSRPELLLIRPCRNYILIRNAAPPKIASRRALLRARLMGGRVVGKNESVLAVLVLEKVTDPLFLHQAGNEIEIGLTVLHAIVASYEVAIET